MRNSKELEDFAERYAAENAHPFMVPDELDLEFYEKPQVFSVSASVAGSVGSPIGDGGDSQDLANGAEPEGDHATTPKNVQGPASNTGPVKYHFPTG